MGKVLDALDSALDRQRESWLSGNRPSVEEIVRDSSLPPESDVLLDLLYGEIVVRESLGEKPTLAEYAARFPTLADELKLHFEVHEALSGSELGQTIPFPPGDEPGAEEISSPWGFTLKDYEIVGEIGRGGMGVVYRARHKRLKRTVALKLLDPSWAPTRRERSRFLAEAEAFARLQHPNVVQIFEVGEEVGRPFIALEFVPGGTLARRLKDLRITPRGAAELLETLARAVHHAHQQQIVHRDLKPANILFTSDGAPKVTDFGLAKLLEDDAGRDATLSGEPIGTPRYMAPEQAAGQNKLVSPATDVYALGTILYEGLTGQVPFVSTSAVETMDRIRNDVPIAPRNLNRNVSRDLETICLKCLEKKPGDRYASALDLADDLRRHLNGEPITARPAPVWVKLRWWARRRPKRAAAVAALFFGAVFLAAGLGIRQHRENQRIANLRSEVDRLVEEGRAAIDRGDDRTAQSRFLAAWSRVLAEPDLHDYVTGVSGWLDHSRRQAEQQVWRMRQPPLTFDERREEAYAATALATDPRSVQDAEEAIDDALALTVSGDQAWDGDREQLLLLASDLQQRQGKIEEALKSLDTEGDTRILHLRRAALLDELNRADEAKRERDAADKLPPQEPLNTFLLGLGRLRQNDLPGASSAFRQVLADDPNHFLGRFFLSVCQLRSDKPGEAEVGLTACIAQRPRFVWNYLFRARAHLSMSEWALAAQDLASCTELKPNGTAARLLADSLTEWRTAVRQLPAAERQAVGRELIATRSGRQAIAEVAPFGNVE